MVSKIRPGDRVLLTGWKQPVEVASADDRALLTLLSPEGREFKGGRMTIGKVFPKASAAPHYGNPGGSND